MKIYSSDLIRDGFYGHLYVPDCSLFPGKALMVVGGGDGAYSVTRMMAKRFAEKGILTLALAYWNRPGLRDTYTEIPLEIAEKAAAFLHGKGIRKVALGGISAGAEYALVCGSYFPELIQAVIAISPSHAVIQGFQMCNGRHFVPRPLPASPYTYRGNPLPYVRTEDRSRECFRESVRRKTVYFRPGYAHNFERATEETVIHAENCSGPILLLAADQDDMWDSRRACAEIVKRLQEKAYTEAVEFYHYPYGSHMLLPGKTRFSGMFAMERQHPREYAESCEDAMGKMMDFLKRW